MAPHYLRAPRSLRFGRPRRDRDFVLADTSTLNANLFYELAAARKHKEAAQPGRHHG